MADVVGIDTVGINDCEEIHISEIEKVEINGHIFKPQELLFFGQEEASGYGGECYGATLDKLGIAYDCIEHGEPFGVFLTYEEINIMYIQGRSRYDEEFKYLKRLEY